MAKKIYDSVLGKLAVEVPLFAESILNKALDKVGATPSDVTAFQMKKAIEDHIEQILKKKMKLNKGIQELGAGVIVLDKKGNIRKYSPVIDRLLPDLQNRDFIINKDISSEIIRSEDKTLKILTLPIITEGGELEGAVCLVSDITLDIELDEEMSSAYIQILNQKNELMKTNEELHKSEKILDQKIEQLKTNKIAMLNMMEDLQDAVAKLEKADREVIFLKEYNENILESSPNPITVIKGKQIEYVNNSFVSYFGETKNHYTSKDLMEVFSSDEIPIIEELLQDFDEIKELKNKSRVFSASSFVIKKAEEEEEEEEERVGIILQDITERKNAEKKLKEKLEELEEFKKITVGRELKMIELKDRIRELEGNQEEK